MITILLISEQGRLSYQVHSFSSHALALPYPAASQPVRSSVSSSAPSRLLNQLRATMTRKCTLKTLAHPDERTYQTTTEAMSTKECAIHHRDSPRESHNDICLPYLLHTHIYLCAKSADIKGDPAASSSAVELLQQPQQQQQQAHVSFNMGSTWKCARLFISVVMATDMEFNKTIHQTMGAMYMFNSSRKCSLACPSGFYKLPSKCVFFFFSFRI